MTMNEDYRSVAVKALADSLGTTECDEKLWDVVTAYEGFVFRTFKGLEYSYIIKRDRNGSPTKELFFDRKDKGITLATLSLALKNALDEQKENGYVKGPKKLKVFGASYIYPMFAEFEVIRIRPEICDNV